MQAGAKGGAIEPTGQRVVVLGTGGTIAGVSDTGQDRDYQAARLGVAQLLDALPGAPGVPLECLQVAQVDSKDMDVAVWRVLLDAVRAQLGRDEVLGVVITHGTDTLEETALLLHLLLPPGKPVVLTAAMRPASSVQADGPQNLLDAVRTVVWAAQQGLCGVVAVMAGRVWAAPTVRKAHSWAVDAFDGGGVEPLLTWSGEQPEVRGQTWPRPLHWSDEALPPTLPRVLCLDSHADVDGSWWAALFEPLFERLPAEDWPRGVVLACTGHGTLHQAWSPLLQVLAQRGVVLWRSTRVARGGVSPAPVPPQPQAQPMMAGIAHLTPAQARLLLSVALWCRPHHLTDVAAMRWGPVAT